MFKKGDKVRCTNNCKFNGVYNTPIVGEIYTVVGTITYHGVTFVTIEMKNFGFGDFLPERFELYSVDPNKPTIDYFAITRDFANGSNV